MKGEIVFFLIFIFISSCQNSDKNNKSQAKTYKSSEISEVISLGTGYKSSTQEATGEAIEYSSTEFSSGDATGQKVVFYCDIVKNYQDLFQKSRLTIDANFKLGTFCQDFIRAESPGGMSLSSPHCPVVIPIHLYLHDFDQKQLMDVQYENENSMSIPPGKYNVYVEIDTKGRLYNASRLFRERSVVSLNENEYLTLSFLQ